MKLIKLINQHIEELKLRQIEIMDIQTMPGTFHHAKLGFCVAFLDFKIAIWKALIEEK